jgi:predicted nucleic acid-binding protein
VRSLLDTSVLVGPAFEAIEGDLAISAMSLAELHFGVLVARSEQVRSERLLRLAAIERNFDALPIDDAVAREYGRLSATVTAAGRSPRRRVADLLIAATARTHDAVLWTRNLDDFRGLEELVQLSSPVDA